MRRSFISLLVVIALCVLLPSLTLCSVIVCSLFFHSYATQIHNRCNYFFMKKMYIFERFSFSYISTTTIMYFLKLKNKFVNLN